MHLLTTCGKGFASEARRENKSGYAGNQGEEELLKAACPKAEVLASAVMQHHHAEAYMSSGDPRNACAAAEAGLRQLDHCLPHTQVSSSPSSKPAALGIMLASHINPAPQQLHAPRSALLAGFFHQIGTRSLQQ